MEHSKRHILIYKLLRPLIAPFFKLIVNYKCDVLPDTGRPALILSNHVTDIDPPLAAIACRRHMYFVASEHVFRWGLASKLIRFAFAPIVRLKGRSGAGATKEILRALRGGLNVCIFPEGNRTFTGETQPFVAATGKLAKASGADLVTFRFEGGYFDWPRWADTRRRGPMYGRVVALYPAERLAEMTADEVNAIIARDLYEDAYARQRANPAPHRGKRLAEYLQIALYLCPACGGFGTLRTEDDRFACACGLHGRYTEYGFLEGEGLPFDSVAAWDRWQRERLSEIARQSGDWPLFSDEGQSLYEIDPCVSSTLLEEGTLQMGAGALTLGGHSFPLGFIPDMAISGRMTLTFSFGGRQYEIKSAQPRSAVKYLHLYQIVKGARD